MDFYKTDGYRYGICMHLVFLPLAWSQLACSNATDPTPVSADSINQSESLDVLADKWKRSQNQFTLEMAELSEMERLYVVRQILGSPKADHSPRLCQTLNKQHKDYCIQMLSRSHIWDIPVATDTIVRTKPIEISDCATNDVWCLTSTAIQDTRHGRIEQAKKICASLPDVQAMEECFFQSAEQIAKQDRSGSLEDAFTFCRRTTAYREHCHAHIIEYAATTFQPPLELLTTIEDNLPTQQSSFLKDYYLTMKSRHSPFNRFIPHWDKHSVQTLIFLSTQTKSDRSLQDWIELFATALPTLNIYELKQDEEINNYWVQQGRAQHPSKLYLSLETRPFSDEESLDLEFAMVAGLIQRQFPVDTIKQQAVHPTIQWMIDRSRNKR